MARECSKQQGPDYICKPGDLNFCVQMDDVLFYRTRISRILLHNNLPFMSPHFDGRAIEELADIQAWKRSGLLASFRVSARHLTLALALICEGLLEMERRWMTGQRWPPSAVVEAAVQLLPEVLAGPWSQVTLSGWPVFALLARLARKWSPPFGGKRSPCPAANPWHPVLRIFNATGVRLPPDNYTLFELADFRRFGLEFMRWDSSCLWEAADRISIPQGPVCVTVPTPGSAKPLVAARDCNAQWPGCEAVAPPALHYWLQLPHRRELTADTVREEQRPYCALNRLGWVVSEAQALFAQLAAEHRQGAAKRPLRLVEVGSNFGDCAFAVNAIARNVGWPLQATCFEPGPAAVQVFKKSLRLNPGARDSITLREAAIIAGHERKVEFVIPEYSGVHGDVAGGYGTKSMLEAGKTETLAVAATRLDREFPGVVDLLLIGTTAGEVEVLQGAEQLLRERRLGSIITLTWDETRLRNHFETIGGYNFVKEFKIGVNSLHLLRA